MTHDPMKSAAADEYQHQETLDAAESRLAVEASRADVAERMVADANRSLRDAANRCRFACTENGSQCGVCEVIYTALSLTEPVVGRWVSGDSFDDVNAALGEANMQRDAAIARAEKAEKALDEVEEELGCIKEAVTQHLPTYVTDDGEGDDFDAVETIEEAGRDLALRSTGTHGVSAGTYAKRVDERDAYAATMARLRLFLSVGGESRGADADEAAIREGIDTLTKPLLAMVDQLRCVADVSGELAQKAIRARDEVGIQLAAAQAVIARMQPVVDAARDCWTTWGRAKVDDALRTRKGGG